MAEATAGKRVALITAPTSEVGAAVVARFAREGWATVGCGDAGVRERGPAGSTASGGQPDLTLDGDITRPADAQRIVDAVVDRFGRLDALVNYGAARRVVGTIMDITDTEFDEEMAAD